MSKRNVIVFIETGGEFPCFDDHVELIQDYETSIEFQKFYCILCAYEYLKKNHEKVLLVWIRPYGTICSLSAHTKEDMEEYIQLKGVCNFYDKLIQSNGINQIPRFIMHLNSMSLLNPTFKRPDDLFLGYDNLLLPSEFFELIKELKSQNT